MHSSEAIQTTVILQPSSNITLIAFDLHSLKAIRGVKKEIISPVWEELKSFKSFTLEKNNSDMDTSDILWKTGTG